MITVLAPTFWLDADAYSSFICADTSRIAVPIHEPAAGTIYDSKLGGFISLNSFELLPKAVHLLNRRVIRLWTVNLASASHLLLKSDIFEPRGFDRSIAQLGQARSWKQR